MAVSIEHNMGQPDKQTAWAQMLWYAYLTGDNSQLDTKVKTIRKIFKRLPSPPRPTISRAPFRS